MSQNQTTEDGVTTKSTINTQTSLQTCVLNADLKALEEHLMRIGAHQSDLNRCLLYGLQIVQQKVRELSHVAPVLTLLLQAGAKWISGPLLDNHKTPYHVICESPGDHHELLALMIISSQRSMIDVQDISEFTATLYAVRHANIHCLNCLISYGADLNIGGTKFQILASGIPPLQWSPITEAINNLGYDTSANVHTNIFHILLDNLVEVYKYSFACNTSPIAIAVYRRNIYCIKELIYKGTRLDMDHPFRVWASIAKLGDVELLDCMFNNGIDINIRDLNGLCMLDHVVASDSIKAVRCLLDKGVAIPNYTPEVHKMQCEKCKENMLMLQCGNKGDRPDSCLIAIHKSKLEILMLLDKYGNQRCKSFHALRNAVLYGRKEVVIYLLYKYIYPLNVEYIQCGAQYSSANRRTLLTELSSTSLPSSIVAQITKLLLDHGADPAKPMCSETSPNALLAAISRGHVDVIAQYIRSGIDINVRSYDFPFGNVIPFEASVLHSFHNVAELLLMSGCSRGMFSLGNSHPFQKNIKPELQKLMTEWKVQENNVTPLEQRCRSVILNHLSPRANMKIENLPLPTLLIKFLNFHELNDIAHAKIEDP